jgi:hypothetical protein
MKKTFLIFLLGLSAANVNAQDIPRTVSSAQPITATGPEKKSNDPKIIIQEQRPAAVNNNIPTAKPAVQASQVGNIPYALNKQNFFDNQVTVSIPSNFVPADDQLVRSQYPDSKNLPKVVLTDNTKRPLLALNLTPNYGDRQDIVHGRTVAIMEVVIPNKDGANLYNMMAFRYIGNNFFFLNFTCPEEDMGLWQDTAREIAENVKINSAY